MSDTFGSSQVGLQLISQVLPVTTAGDMMLGPLITAYSHTSVVPPHPTLILSWCKIGRLRSVCLGPHHWQMAPSFWVIAWDVVFHAHLAIISPHSAALMQLAGAGLIVPLREDLAGNRLITRCPIIVYHKVGKGGESERAREREGGRA